jgi:hypothetical protein
MGIVRKRERWVTKRKESISSGKKALLNGLKGEAFRYLSSRKILHDN